MSTEFRNTAICTEDLNPQDVQYAEACLIQDGGRLGLNNDLIHDTLQWAPWALLRALHDPTQYFPEEVQSKDERIRYAMSRVYSRADEFESLRKYLITSTAF